MKFKRAIPHDITIVATPNGGFIVTVGCVQVAYSNYGSLLQDLTEYLADPGAVERQYMADIKCPDRVHLGPNTPSFNTASNMLMATAHGEKMMRKQSPDKFKVEPTGGY